jgi:hypothetical protein
VTTVLDQPPPLVRPARPRRQVVLDALFLPLGIVVALPGNSLCARIVIYPLAAAGFTFYPLVLGRPNVADCRCC